MCVFFLFCIDDWLQQGIRGDTLASGMWMQIGQAIGAAAQGDKHKGKKGQSRGDKHVCGMKVACVRKETTEQKDPRARMSQVSPSIVSSSRCGIFPPPIVGHVFGCLGRGWDDERNGRLSLGHFSFSVGQIWPPKARSCLPSDYYIVIIPTLTHLIHISSRLNTNT